MTLRPKESTPNVKKARKGPTTAAESKKKRRHGLSIGEKEKKMTVQHQDKSKKWITGVSFVGEVTVKRRLKKIGPAPAGKKGVINSKEAGITRVPRVSGLRLER